MNLRITLAHVLSFNLSCSGLSVVFVELAVVAGAGVVVVGAENRTAWFNIKQKSMTCNLVLSPLLFFINRFLHELSFSISFYATSLGNGINQVTNELINMSRTNQVTGELINMSRTNRVTGELINMSRTNQVTGELLNMSRTNFIKVYIII